MKGKIPGMINITLNRAEQSLYFYPIYVIIYLKGAIYVDQRSYCINLWWLIILLAVILFIECVAIVVVALMKRNKGQNEPQDEAQDEQQSETQDEQQSEAQNENEMQNED